MSILDFFKTDWLARSSDRGTARKISDQARRRGAELFLRERLEQGESLAMVKFLWARDWPELQEAVNFMNEVSTAASDLDDRLKTRRAG